MSYTDENNNHRLSEGGPEPIKPEDTISGMETDSIRAELFERLGYMGVTPPQPFSAARNEQVRALMTTLTPFKADGGPLSPRRTNLTRILALLFELRNREIRSSA